MSLHDTVVHHRDWLKRNKDKTITTEVRVIVYLEDGTELNAVRKIRFKPDEIETAEDRETERVNSEYQLRKTSDTGSPSMS